MKIKNDKNRNTIFWFLQIFGWSAYGIVDGYIKYVDGATSFKWILTNIIIYLTGILITSILRIFYRRLLKNSKSILSIFLNIILYSVPAAILWTLFLHIFIFPVWGFKSVINHYLAYSGIEKFSMLYLNAMVTIAWSGLYFGIKYILEWNIQKLQIEKTELLLESANLKLLRYQLNPHFLFNSLSSLRMLIRKDAKRAEHMLDKIADFLRYSLSGTNKHEVPFSEELKSIKQYFEIEKIRFAEKIDIEYSISPLAEDFPIPIFLIHPLVENAIKYGMDSSNGKLMIEIYATVKDQSLTIKIINSGKWIDSTKHKNGTGTGLDNVRKRLELAYPNNHTLEINKTNNKVSVKLKVTRELENN